MSGHVKFRDQPDDVLQAMYDFHVDVASAGHPLPSGMIGESPRYAMAIKAEQNRRVGIDPPPVHAAWLDALNEDRPPAPKPLDPTTASS